MPSDDIRGYGQGIYDSWLIRCRKKMHSYNRRPCCTIPSCCTCDEPSAKGDRPDWQAIDVDLFWVIRSEDDTTLVPQLVCKLAQDGSHEEVQLDIHDRLYSYGWPPTRWSFPAILLIAGWVCSSINAVCSAYATSLRSGSCCTGCTWHIEVLYWRSQWSRFCSGRHVWCCRSAPRTCFGTCGEGHLVHTDMPQHCKTCKQQYTSWLNRHTGLWSREPSSFQSPEPPSLDCTMELWTHLLLLCWYIPQAVHPSLLRLWDGSNILV